MTTIGWLGLAAAVILAALDWVAVSRSHDALERVAKPGVVAALAVVVLAAEPVEPAIRVLVIVALVASFLGDVLLLPPGRVAAGLAAFLVAQLAYAAAFAAGSLEITWLAIGLVVALAVAVLVGRPILIAARSAMLGPPVALYLLAILAMATLATGSGEPAAALGGWSFVGSDALLGWSIFVDPPAPDESDDPRRRVAIMATYHPAQILLVLALVG